MSTPLLAITAVIYLWVAVDQWLKGSPGLALTFVAYSVANVGLILAASK